MARDAAPAPRAAPRVRGRHERSSGPRTARGKRASTGRAATTACYLGETYDARREIAGWREPGFDDSRWAAARVVSGPAGVLRAQAHEPIRVVDTLATGTRAEPAPGIVVYDVGQNLTGWAELELRAPAGTAVEVFYSEKLDENGRASTKGNDLVHGQLQTDYYVAAGTGAEKWTPAFSYKGFQYVQLSGTGRRAAARGRLGRPHARAAGPLRPFDLVAIRVEPGDPWTGSTATRPGRSRATSTASSPTRRSTRRTPGPATRSSPPARRRCSSTRSGSTGSCSRTCSTRRGRKASCRSCARATRTTATSASPGSSRRLLRRDAAPGTPSGSSCRGRATCATATRRRSSASTRRCGATSTTGSRAGRTRTATRSRTR